MNIKFALAATAAALIATPALAQEDAPFTGPRVEALVGYDSIHLGSGLGNAEGVSYGIGVGYDFQMGGALVGIEGEAADSTADKTVGGTKLSARRDLYVGARAGFVTGSSLIYAKVGYTNLRVNARGFGSDNGDGIRAGVGVEHALNGPLFVKAEYRYSNYEAGVERHQGIVGLGYRF